MPQSPSRASAKSAIVCPMTTPFHTPEGGGIHGESTQTMFRRSAAQPDRLRMGSDFGRIDSRKAASSTETTLATSGRIRESYRFANRDHGSQLQVPQTPAVDPASARRCVAGADSQLRHLARR